MNEMINQIEKYQLIFKQSNVLIGKLSAINPEDVQNSILGIKGVRKDISTTKARFMKKQ